MNTCFEKDASVDGNSFNIKSLPDDIKDMVARGFVREVMQNIYSGEGELGYAQVLLCNDVDRTLMTLYQKQQDISPLSHWSTRWGKRLWDTDNDHEDFFDVKRSSRSSSPDSFHSARSESRLVVNRPVDFLGHAASYCLSRYVMNKLDLQRRCHDKEYATYLLCCSIFPLSNTFYWRRHRQSTLLGQLHLVAELLRLGGNPNVYIGDFSTTIWGKFIHGTPWGDLSAQKAVLVTMKAFLENGANIHIETLPPTIIDISEPLQCQANSGPVRYTKMRLRSDVSLLYFIRRLEYMPELKELEEILLAKGGRSSIKCSLVALGKDKYRWYRIPTEEHDKLIAASNAASNAICQGFENPSFVLDYRMWAREIRRIYEENLEKDGDSDSRVSTDEDISSSTDAEEEFPDSTITLITAEMQGGQVIDE